MRLKEFIYCMIFFTIVYWTFWIVLDLIMKKKNKSSKLKKIDSILIPEKFYSFANFYGIQKTFSKELLTSIYNDICPLIDFKISDYSNKYQVTPYEFIVIVLYLEYYDLINKKKIFYEEDHIKSLNYKENTILYKYGSLFLDNASFEQIQSKIGSIAFNDLMDINKYFLYPGVRFINSTIYYFGGSNEKNRVIIYVLLIVFFVLFNFYLRPISGNKLVTKKYKNSKTYVNDLYMSDEYFRKNLIKNKEGEKLFYKVLNDIKSGNKTTTIECKKDCTIYLNVFSDILYLDYPELIGFEHMGWEYDDIKKVKINYYGINSFVSYLGAKRIERELDIIKNETKNMSDKEKIIYVYKYVASHQYDRTFTYTTSNQSAYSFFTKKNSVCAGFAKASQLVFQNIGIKSYTVMNASHMWNYVEYDGKYYVFDATVGASCTDKSCSTFYDGLGQTTVDTIIGNYSELYPKIEKKTLKELFGL